MAVWPAIVARHKVMLPPLAGWSTVTLFDGPPVTGEAPAEYLTLGFVFGEDYGGTYEQAEGPGTFLDERGQVRSELVLLSGETDLVPLRARAFALVDAWSAAVRADQTLGGTMRPSSTASLAVDVQPVETRQGAVQRLTVTLNYLARTVA